MKSKLYRLLCLCAVLAGVLLISSCAGSGTNDGTKEETTAKKELTFSAIADAVNGAVTFEEALEEIEADVADMLYGCGEYTSDVRAYCCGSGALAEELVIFKAKSSEAAGNIIETMKGYRDMSLNRFTTYNPPEVPKLRDAVIIKAGDFVVYCVSPDAPAVLSALEKLN